MSRVSIYRSFDQLPTSARDLFDAASSRSGIFLSLPWFRLLSSCMAGHGRKLRIYFLRPGADGGAGMVVPMWHQEPSRRIFAVRRLDAVANFYTPLFGPIVAENSVIPGLTCAVAQAIASDTERWDMVSIHPLDRDVPLFGEMQSAFRQARMVVQRYRCFGNWYLKINGRSSGEYFSTLPPRLRNTLQRKEKQLSRADRSRFEVITGAGDALERGIAAYETIYRASWKPAEASPDFVPALIRTCAREGWLRLGLAYIDGQPAAAQIWTVANGIASIYKLAYEPKFARYSIGSLLTAQLMQHVIDIDGVQEVDFLSGDDPYKQDWMSHRRERWGIIAFNLRTVNGVALATLHIGGKAVKDLLKSFTRRWRPQPVSGASTRTHVAR